MARFEHELTLKCSPSSVFDFLLRPENIRRISDPGMGLKFTSAPDVLSAGSQVQFEIVSFNQVHRITHEIETVRPFELLVERQVKGTMGAWLHTHRYEETENGVLIVDEIDFELPGGILGMLLSEDSILDQLEDGFEFRAQQLERFVEDGTLA
ncbi:MAG: hypothetical protein KDA88_06170 [Planctomycetaceae bacterium]|nr:hypothetical protein [Planctomycetaceae bacterium]MCB9951460.1 hypothetical protein [Planctomycetaceae bacterium]